MIKNISLILVLIVAVSCKTVDSTTTNKINMKAFDLSIFPNPEEGFVKYIIELEPQENEDDFQVELYAGKNAKVDCNKHTLIGEFAKKNLEGWGYNYYKFESDGQMRSTLMACPDSELKDEFVRSLSIKVRYNSKLPIVIYAPESFEINYQIWERGTKVFKALKNNN